MRNSLARLASTGCSCLCAETGCPAGCERRSAGASAYAWSKSDLEVPGFLRIRWRAPVARSRFPCQGMGVRRPFAGFTHRWGKSCTFITCSCTPMNRRYEGCSDRHRPPVDIPTELVDGLRFLFINIGVARTLIPF